VLTDSAAALPKDVAAEAGIDVVPMWLTIGGTTVHDGELGLEELVARFDEGVSTSGPTPGEFVDKLEAAGTAEGAVIVTVASTMSATSQAAELARQMVDVDRVRVVDSGTAAGAQGLVALAAARVAGNGGDVDAVEAAARRATSRVRLVATIPSLEWLAKGGRVPDAAAWAARWLNVHPMFEFRGGAAHPMRPVLSERAALQRIVARFANDVSDRPSRVAALHALAEPVAEELLALADTRATVVDSYVAPFSAVMVAHTGPGVVGLAWCEDDAPSA
jgi:DegV family protein with EDD domain